MRKSFSEIDNVYIRFQNALQCFFTSNGNLREKLRCVGEQLACQIYWDRDLKENIPIEAESDFLFLKKILNDDPIKELEIRAKKAKLTPKEYSEKFCNATFFISLLNSKTAKKASIALLNIYLKIEEKRTNILIEKNAK